VADLFVSDEAEAQVPAASSSRPRLKGDCSVNAARPLADKMRPQTLAEVTGQEHLTGKDGVLTRMLAGGGLSSMIFWGPPGTGKTTIARLLAHSASLDYEQISAIFSGVADLKKLFEHAKERRRATGKSTLLFVDEIHRFNRTQQDSFLPVMEDGTIILIGATTENPSFALNAALLSRARVLVFNRHDEASLETLLERAEQHEGKKLPLDLPARAVLLRMADGDARAALSSAEELWRAVRPNEILTADKMQAILQRRAPVYDKSRDGHYNLISALHKSVRGSDPNAALYYLCRMFDGGEDPLYIGRRLVRMASEDIGLADPQALGIANAAKEAYQYLGSPEGELALAQACVYLASAPKSNAVYVAYKRAMRSAKEHGSLLPPKHILNAPTKMMEEQGYGAAYRYDHDEPNAFSGQDYFPEELGRQQYYQPTPRGFEKEIGRRMEWWDAHRQPAVPKSAAQADNESDKAALDSAGGGTEQKE